MTATFMRPTKPPHYERSDCERVVITGMGAITPLGNDISTTWQNLIAGKSGIVKIEKFVKNENVTDFRSRIAGLIKNFDAKQLLNPKDVRRYDEFMHYAQVVAAQALFDAKLTDGITGDFLPINVTNERFGVIMGSGIGGLQTLENSRDTLKELGINKVSPFIIPGTIINMPAGLIAIRHGLKGANLATATACTTSTHAIGLGARLIAYGDLDAVLVGGSEKASTALGMAGFGAMHALSSCNDSPQKASRPFDKDRDGFVLGDGAGALVLESLAHAKARGAKILAELAGFGMSDDASHITAPPEDGQGARRAMQNAIDDAAIDVSQIGYINAHGTSTPAGDIAESAAITALFGNDILVSSTKSMTGHLLGAAGAIEAIFSVLALQHQILPPTINLDNPDPRCTLDYIPHHQRLVSDLKYVMSNSFGFGGTNGSLIFKIWEH